MKIVVDYDLCEANAVCMECVRSAFASKTTTR